TAVRCMVACAAIIAVAFTLGFDPDASAPDWLGVFGLVLLVSFGAAWLTVALGLAAKTPESAGLATVPLIMLPFVSSAFVPADTMGTGVRQFVEYQPFTPIIETLRGLLDGQHASTGDTVAAFAWSIGFAIVGYAWAVSTFKRRA
ncbi:MAG: ABC transporter permease, partial [Streptomycetaceae bacterium]|nr:ABC transporter permease [Streptomycetaceae bacterium]